MNILYLVNYAGKGGSEKYVWDLAANLPKGQAFFIYNIEGRLCEDMRRLGIQPVQVTMRHPFDLRAAKEIAGYCESHEIDLIHTQFQRENYIALLAKKQLKKRLPGLAVVYTSHINLKNNFLWKALNSWMGSYDDGIIAVCSVGKRLLIENKMPEGKITIIPNGVSIKKESSLTESQLIRSEFHIAKETFLFVSLTRFTPEKGTAFLLRAVKSLAGKTEKPFQVLLAGEGPLLQELQDYVAANNLEEYVIFSGYRTDADKILAAAQAFVNSSKSEASSLALLEAMSQGLPVIAANVGGNGDIVHPEAGCGLLVSYGDEEGLSQAMKKLIDDPELATELGCSGRRRVEENFSIEKTRADTFGVYRKLIRK